MTLQQANVLFILRRSDGDALPTLEVAARLVEQTPGITRLVKTLEAKKYIRRRRCKQDNRQQLCSLTDKGRRLVDEILPPIRASCASIMKRLGSDDLTTLVALLGRIAKPVR